MIRLAFKLASFFWILSPIAYLMGRGIGLWNFQHDIAIFAFLMVMCLGVSWLNCPEPEDHQC